MLLEFNVGGETSKYGWLAAEAAQQETLLPEVETVLGLSHLQVRGLMTMPPLETDPEQARVYFRKLREMRDRLEKRYPQSGWRELSMGTSVDFEIAIEEGATMVRIGTAILGSRPAREGE